MGSSVLVAAKFEAGKVFLKELDKSSWKLTVAVWIYDSDLDKWEFLVASPALDGLNLFDAYKVMAETLRHSDQNLQISDIKVTKTNEPVVNGLRSAIRTNADSISNIHLENIILENIIVDRFFIQEALAFRLV